MKRVLLASTMALAIAGVATVIGVSAIAAPAPSITVSVPERADNFQLTDHTRLAHELHYFKDAKAIVLMSQINGSDVSRKSAAELEKLKAAYKDQGVLFYMINSKDSRDAAAVEAKAQSFDIPILVDELQLVGESLGVQREGEIFVVDPKSGFKIAYHGPLAETGAALDAVVAGKPVANARVEVKSGANIAFPARAKTAEFKNIKYSGEITKILQDKCVTCHQKGGIAPFAMDSYDVVKTMAPMIREAIRRDRMPPFDADNHYRAFAKNENLTAELAEANPGLIHVSVTPFGREGPYADFAGSELVCSALGGTLWSVGYEDRAPVKEALDACIFHAAATAATGASPRPTASMQPGDWPSDTSAGGAYRQNRTALPGRIEARVRATIAAPTATTGTRTRIHKRRRATLR